MDNLYDNEKFFNSYEQMARSKEGLTSAGEWHQLQPLIPSLAGAKVLDLGCGYGWHSKYAVEQGAVGIIAIDLSEKMINKAKQMNADAKITYKVMGIDDYTYPPDTFDFVISNLVLHYVQDLDVIYQKVFRTLKPNGTFLFNIEHPVFTAGVNEEWIFDESGAPKAWPIDNYFYPGERMTTFLGQSVKKQHHTLTQILMGLLKVGFSIEVVEEAQPSEKMMSISGMKDEMRRPMMMIVKAIKNRG